MNDHMNLTDMATVSVERNREIKDKIGLKGKYVVEHIRDGQVINTYQFENTITNEGKNKLLDVMFFGATAISTWYIGLIDAASFSATPNTDTAASHSGWSEFTGYSESVRQTWTTIAAASQQTTNTTPAVFTANVTGNVRGIFVISNSTKSGSSGTLWSTALFPATSPVVSGDVLKITYTVAG